MTYNNTLVLLDFDVFGVAQLDKLEEIKKQSSVMTVCVVDKDNTDAGIVPTEQKVQIISSLRCVDNCFSKKNEDINGSDYDAFFTVKF